MNKLEDFVYINYYYWPGAIAAGSAILNYVVFLIKDSAWIVGVNSGYKYGSILRKLLGGVYHLTLIFVAIFGLIAFFFGKEKDLISDSQQRNQAIEYAKYKKDADLKIAESNASAEVAKRDASNANKAAEVAKRDATNAHKEAAVANKAAAQLKEKAAKLEADNLRLKQQLSWRTIDSDQRATITNKLRIISGVDVELVSVVGDAEGLNYANQIADVIKSF